MRNLDPSAQITLFSPASAEAAIAALTLACSSDPVARWCWPDSDAYLRAFPRFARAFAGEAFSQDSAIGLRGAEAAALFLPPGVGSNEAALVALIEETVAASQRPALYALLEEMSSHHPEEPHWYLPLIGVDPCSQNRGIGHALMRPILQRCDALGLPAYLESSNPRNVSLYERLGFRVMGSLLIGGIPVVTPMVREPA